MLSVLWPFQVFVQLRTLLYSVLVVSSVSLEEFRLCLLFVAFAPTSSRTTNHACVLRSHTLLAGASPALCCWQRHLPRSNTCCRCIRPHAGCAEADASSGVAARPGGGGLARNIRLHVDSHNRCPICAVEPNNSAETCWDARVLSVAN